MVKIALLGPKGTFTDVAYFKYKQEYDELNSIDVEYYKSIDDVFYNINDETVIGIVPLENTLDGYVQRTLDLLLEENMVILDEVIVPVNFNLLANCKDIKDLKTIYVQFKANGQCRKLLKELNDIDVISTESNMESYYKLSSSDLNCGAIVPCHINDNEKLLLSNVADSSNNFTRFLVITKKDYLNNCKYNNFLNKFNMKKYNKLKTSICVIPENDRPGLLFDILRSIYENNINMVSIMSRPTKNSLGTYNFYIEMESDIEDDSVIIKTLDDIKNQNKDFIDIKILGKYKINK